MGLVQSCLMDGCAEERVQSSLILEESARVTRRGGTPANSPPRVVLSPLNLLTDEGDEELTPDDTEYSLLSDPRFEQFLVQSPSFKRDLSAPLIQEKKISEGELDRLYTTIQEGRVDSFIDQTKTIEDIGAIRFEGELNPLHLAVIHGHPAIVEHLLMIPGVSASDTDSLGRSPMDWAALEKSEDVRRLLQAHVEKSSSSSTTLPPQKKSLAGRIRKYTGRLFSRQSA